MFTHFCKSAFTYAGLLILVTAAACNPAVVSPTVAQTATQALVSLPSPKPVMPTSSLSPVIPLTPTATSTRTPTPIPTTTLTPIPTYTILRGEVLVRANCRYGPGAPYLYKYGLVPGSNLEIIGRTDRGNWILVRAIGGNNPCWVKASLMDVKGDVMSVEPTYIPLPQSPFYAPPEWVLAKRSGDEVTVYWKSVSYRAGDETAEAPYLIEAWVCQDGKLVFTPLGVYETQTIITDETGCSELSYGRLYFVEKHGYSRWIKIPWPAHRQGGYSHPAK